MNYQPQFPKRICLNCGLVLQPDWVICPDCGTRAGERPAPPAAPPPPAQQTRIAHVPSGGADKTQLIQTHAAAFLVCKSGPDKGRKFDLRPQETRIGRERGPNQIVLGDPTVSGLHAKILMRDSGCMLYDLGSRNGTWVNGATLEGGMSVNDGDEIQLGETVLIFKMI